MTHKKSLIRLTLFSCILFASGSLFGQWNGDSSSRASSSGGGSGSSSQLVVVDSSGSADSVKDVTVSDADPVKEKETKDSKAKAVYVSRYRHGNRAE